MKIYIIVYIFLMGLEHIIAQPYIINDSAISNKHFKKSDTIKFDIIRNDKTIEYHVQVGIEHYIHEKWIIVTNSLRTPRYDYRKFKSGPLQPKYNFNTNDTISLICVFEKLFLPKYYNLLEGEFRFSIRFVIVRNRTIIGEPFTEKRKSFFIDKSD